jgi:hypothetical protein
MNTRRQFLGLMVGGVAAAAAIRTWPFRVYSFPSQPIMPPYVWLDMNTWERLEKILDRPCLVKVEWGIMNPSRAWHSEIRSQVWPFHIVDEV